MRTDRSEDRVLAIQVVAGMVALMWVLEVIDVAVGHDLDNYGIHPHDADGLWEIVTAPFLHVGFGHLIGNTIPFALMGAAIGFGGVRLLLSVTAIAILVSGLGVWLIASSNTVHLGASGVVFGYAAFLITRGIFSRRPTELLVGAIVVGIWGLTLLGGLVPHGPVSWQAHVFGAVGGVLAARLVGRRKPAAAAEADPLAI